MTESQDTISATEPPARHKLAKPRRTRGYVPKGDDLEPDQAPTGAAGTSTPVPDQVPDQEPTADSRPTSRARIP